MKMKISKMENKLNITINKSENRLQVEDNLKLFIEEMENIEVECAQESKIFDVDSQLLFFKPFFDKYGFSITQVPKVSKKSISLTTVLMHKSGEWKSVTIDIPLADRKIPYPPNSRDAVISYAKRYGLRETLKTHTFKFINYRKSQ